MKGILVVDDDDAIREGLTELLELMYAEHIERGELQVKAAATGREALDLAGQQPPDLVLMDINMPGMDGIETYYRMRQGEGGTALKALFITGFGDAGNVRARIDQAVTDGAVGFLSKPVIAAEIRSFVQRWVFEGGCQQAAEPPSSTNREPG